MDGNGSSSTSTEIEDLYKKLVTGDPDSMQTTSRKEICIYHVPVNIRILNEAAYTPQVICIGPIHHKKENQVMKELKRRYFKQFFNRLPEEKGGEWELFQDLVSTIKGREDKIRNCYQDEASKLCEDPEDFWKMILCDVVFILELFLKTREYEHDNDRCQDKYKYDIIIGQPWLTAAIQRDLIMLENQLPFWILDELYKIAPKSIKPDCSCFQCIRFHKSGCSCFRCYQDPKPDCSCPQCFQCIRLHKPDCSCFRCNQDPKPDCSCFQCKSDCFCFLELTCQYFKKHNKNKINPQKILHFTDLVRFFLSSKHPDATFSPTNTIHCYRATKLEEAGMKFKLLDNKCLLDIRAWNDGLETKDIKKGELHVPCLEIDDNTECLLRNLMELEQCHFPKEAYICNYVIFLDSLVDTDKDVDLLVENDVIINRLGDSAVVADWINKLCLEIVEVSSCYNNLSKKLNDYSSWYNKSRAVLRRQYFRNVWIGTGTVVGSIVMFISLFNFVRSLF